MDLITIDALVVTTLLGTILPILTGLITKMETSSGFKGTVLLFLSAAAGLLNSAITMDGTAVFSKETLFLAFLAWISSVATYQGILKPAKISTKVQTATATKGIG